MRAHWTVFLPVLVAVTQVHGSVTQKKNPSDFSMYDNQFYRVGDSELDDEVTDCALVDHQFRHGFIRLREYLERKRGCGLKGKLNNIEGIAKSTEDDVNNDNIEEIAKSTTEDFHYTPPSVAKKPAKPKGLAHVINNFKSNKLTYVPRRYPISVHLKPAVKPVFQTAVQRGSPPRPVLQAGVQRGSLQRTVLQAAVQQTNPLKPVLLTPVQRGSLQRPVLQAAVHQTNPIKLVSQAAAQREISPRHYLNEYQQHSALSFSANPYTAATSPVPSDDNEDETNSMQSYPIAKAFRDQYTRLASSYDPENMQEESKHDLLRTFYPSLPRQPVKDESVVKVGQPLFKPKSVLQSHIRVQAPKMVPNAVSNLLKDAMNNFNSFAANRIVSQSAPEGIRPQQQAYSKLVKNPGTNGGSDQSSIDDNHMDMEDPDKNDNSINPPETEIIETNDALVDQSDQKPSALPLIQRPGEELRPNGQVTNQLNSVSTPTAPKVAPQKASPVLANQQQIAQASSASPAAVEDSSLLHPKINLDVLKSKILHSTNATFLRRMLTLIQKITHHKDFQKLNAPARSFVTQANKAVQAVSRAYNDGLGNSPNVQESVNQIYGRDFALTKKFQIARNPYYRNYYRYAPQAYYSNLQRMRYGWYNGNVP